MSEKHIIAMWSGPRNLSTAMMRSFENRFDASVWDEPFYAAYLHDTGLQHPMSEEILAAGEPDWRTVAQACRQPVRDANIFYQKHMTHHMLPAYDRGWIENVSNAFLIREPARVVASYGRKYSEISLADIGFTQQVEIFDLVCDATGKVPPVIDATDVRNNPEGILKKLCAALDITFTRSMLSWPQGSRGSDGIWATHWYDSAIRSTGFAPPEANLPELTDSQKQIAQEAQPIYEHMKQYALQAKPL